MAVVQRECIALVRSRRQEHFFPSTINQIVACAAARVIRAVVAPISIGSLAANIQLVVINIKECHVNKTRCLDAVETITCTVAVLHLSGIGVSCNRGVTFPAVRSHQVTSTECSVRIHEVHVNHLLAKVVLIVVVQCRSH